MTQKILVNDLRRNTSELRGDILSAMTGVLDSGWFVLGQECSSFEKEFAQYCGSTHCVGVANGTDALELALRSLDVAPGSRVATVANAGFYTTTALLAIGARPVFIDVDPDTQLMDLNRLTDSIKSGDVDVIVVTHLFGLMHDMEALRVIADRAHVPVLEDCAQAHGALRNGLRAGSVGHVATFSFYPTKNLGAIGDGGAIVTSDAQIAARLRLLRQYGWESKYCAVVQGAQNSRLDEIQAAVLKVKLPYLDAWNSRRRHIATRYSAGIVHPAVVCPPKRGEEYVAHLYVIECERREALRQHLELAGIGTDVHYPIPDHRQQSIAGMERWPDLPVTERRTATNLTLPCYPELTDDEVDFIIDRINSW